MREDADRRCLPLVKEAEANSVDFDWSSVDGGAEDETPLLDPDELQRMSTALKELLRWVALPRGNYTINRGVMKWRHKRVFESTIARRAIALLWMIDQRAFVPSGKSISLRKVAKLYGWKSRTLAEWSEELRVIFGMRNTYMAHLRPQDDETDQRSNRRFKTSQCVEVDETLHHSKCAGAGGQA